MQAVFFMSEHLKCEGLEDQTIYVFEDEESAEEFILEELIECGLISRDSYGIFKVGDFEIADPDEAIREAQGTFSSLEFFHIYDAVDMREKVNA